MRGIYVCLAILALLSAVANGQQLNCSFDQNNLCSWTILTGSDISPWILNKGPTPSFFTGPPNDHSTNTPNGYYIYYEGDNKTFSDRSQLQSPQFSVSGSKCLTFWYFMYGPSVGNLNVYLKQGSSFGNAVFTRQSTQGPRWIQASINIVNKQNIWVVLEAVRGRNYLCDIAVDDIVLQDGSCGQSGSVTSAPGQSGTATCNFETQSICGYLLDPTGNFNWKWASGSTPTAGTGPTGDHTQQSSAGHYMLMEATGPLLFQKARLVSPTIRPSGAVCLSFYYYMYGQSVSRLSVYTRLNNLLGTPIWFRFGNQGANWIMGQSTLRGVNTSFEIVFEGTRGLTDISDIALDDVLVTNGECGTPGACDFEHGICAWSNSKGDDFDWIVRAGQTPTVNTGPNGDHTLGTNAGHYLYIEADSPRRPNDRAQLVSQVFSGSNQPLCFQFWYSMVGSAIGTLNMYTKVGSITTVVWSLRGNQNNQWNQGKFTVQSTNQFQIIIEGVRGNGITGDIAIDDISTTTSNCALTPNNAVPSSVISGAPTSATTKASTVATTSHRTTNTVTCDFDYDLCGWTQLTTDFFDWTRQKGGTILPGTGPSGDHTSGQGYYLYTAASVRYQNKTAQIESRSISLHGHTQCLTFWYHMYGPNVGTLNLYVKDKPSLGSPIWTRSGTQGNQWMQGAIVMPSTVTFTLVFEAVNGYGFRGDMGLDDINATSCVGVTTSAPGVTNTPAVGNLGARSCNFEQSRICGYTQDTTDQFDWTLDSAGTTTVGTGPALDHTYNTPQGHYMYIETSTPRLRGEKARLISPTYTDSGAVCVKFWYHMYGDGIGTLSVYAKSGNSLGLAIFTMSGDQGNRWIAGQASVAAGTATQAYQVVFEGMVGMNYRGDIAIDDVSFSSGSCGNPGDCDFDGGLCTWTNTQTGDDFDWTQQSGSTATGTTGPDSDHTQGNNQGQYMFIETSAPRQPGDVAWLVSQSFNAVPSSGRCLSFWYHMLGSTVDTLAIVVRPQGQSNVTIWTLKGSQGGNWTQGQAPIPQLGVPYTVVIVGIRGQSYTGDIAIDDITFTSSNCGVSPSKAQPGLQTTAAPTVSTATPGPFNCDFENGLCGWSQDTKDQFDWTRQRGSTSTSNTGPTGDHTSGSGYYVYIETSSGNTGFKARLISPQVLASGTGLKCVSFWYHMYGQNVDRLRMYVQYGLILPIFPLWSRQGTQGNKWIQAQITVSATRPLNIVFEALKGPGDQGDIALDDISITDGTCIVSTTNSPLGAANSTQCDFELSTICGFTQVTGSADQFDWTWDSQGTQSVGTGPSTDHTLGTSRGHYMYIESSFPRTRGQKAQLLSPIYSGTGQQSCLKFWYSMYGNQMGTLNVYTIIGGTFTQVWTKSGNQGSSWMVASYSVPATSKPFQVMFEGVVGSGYLGDLAIDDFSLQPGACSSSGGTCTFDDNTLCTWRQERNLDRFDWQLKNGSTATDQTGPTADHSGNGFYVYIEVSAPRITGENAWLISESFAPGSRNCFSFWYNMYGVTIGTLRIWVSAQDGTRTPVWELKGNQNQAWKQGTALIPPQKTSFTIIVEGIRGDGVTGDIAVDELSVSNMTTCARTPQNAMPSVGTVTPSAALTSPMTTTLKTTPTTTMKRPTTPPNGGTGYPCTFEQGFCGWQQVQGSADQFDWTRKSGPTGTVGTGPSGDHTTGRGNYVYIETSAPRVNGDKAQLIGPTLTLSTTQPQCFSFWYNMIGGDIRALNIYLKQGSNLGSPVFTRFGTQGPNWLFGQITLSVNGAAQIVMEGIRGTSIQGDIAIDDTNITVGACQVSLTGGPTVSSALACNFETTDLCGYTNTQGSDNFDWSRNHGATVTAGTGPFGDHTLGTTAGNYMYIETSAPQQPRQKAQLYSKAVTTSSPICVNFFYHMFGPTIGSLNVYIMRSGQSGVGQAAWTRSGNQQNKWTQGQISVNPSLQPFQLVFEGVVGNGYQGDIAIDDITVQQGACGVLGACTFDTGTLCTWSNVWTGDVFDWTLMKGPTLTSNTGPPADHTQGNAQGTYIYIETSLPRRQGEKAWLQSAIMSPTGSSPQCLHFWYNMYGYNVGALNVYVSQNGSLPGYNVWTLSRNQGNNWLSGQVSVQSSTQFTVIFEGVVGNGVAGDIGLDDLSITSGQCAISPSNALPKGATTPVPTTTKATTPIIATSSPTSFNCNFESNMCAWTQATNDQFNWTRQQGQTGSIATGPTSDHTTGRGYYIYIDASNQRINSSARIVSPRVQMPSPRGPQCLKFWYHMYGAHINTLNVYLPSAANLGQAVWTRKGTQGNLWIQGSVVINATSPYNVVFEALRGVNYAGDIALDDIILTNGACSDSPQTGGPIIDSCSFETNICGFTNDKSGDIFDWTQQAGQTASINTGPSADHTLGTSTGHYMYIETSTPRRLGDTARLSSKVYNASSGDECLQFYYHMFGANIGSLSVKLKVNGAIGTSIWSKSLNQGNQWSQAQVTLAAASIASNFQFVFEGVRGTGSYGDIAIDDIKLSQGSCSNGGSGASPGGCTFETGRCSWTNSQDDDFDWRDGTGRTTTGGTGPSNDHTLNNAQGHYQFLEASAPRRAGAKCWLLSQQFPPTTGRCIQFWYNMYGPQIGSLNLYIKFSGGANQSIWSLSGDQGSTWKNGQAPIKSSMAYQIIMEGFRGSGFQGDIAIDDIAFTDSLCGVQPSNALVNSTAPPVGQTTVPTTPATGAVDCNFDADFCMWSQDQGDNFDWTRFSGSTPSALTGPTADHTSGNGFYVYIETSTPRRQNEKARLYSPQQSAGTTCLSFFYNMYGQNVNSLNLYVKKGAALGSPVFSQSGTKGPAWKSALVDIMSAVPYQLVMEGVVGGGYLGDIAIDDITMTSGSCQTNGNSNFACDFEDSALCGYQQDNSDQFQWSQGSSNTATASTGPTNDHTYGTGAGHYMFIETSAPRVPGDKARLISPGYSGQSGSQNCIEFWYNMYGSTIGTLNVYLMSGSSLGNPVFTQQGNQGNRWIRGQVAFSGMTGVSLVFEGIRGQSFLGDIAIDDVTMKPGSCGGGTQGDCNFEVDTCSWSNSNNDTFDWQSGSGRTSTTGTGPSMDNTFKNLTGHYIFIESSAPRSPGDNAILQSVMFSGSSSSLCVQFYYNMYGNNIGTLRVWTQPQGGAAVKVWELSGNQGIQWSLATVNVGQTTQFQVLFEAIRGNGYQGDIAIDDVTFLSQTCTLTPANANPSFSTTTVQLSATFAPATIPAGFTCNFDTNYCGWTQDKTDNFDWTRYSGSTSSVGTGPSNDHSGGGYYMYIETSAPRLPGDLARLISPTINGASTMCMTFWYHMYGPHIKDLNVYLAQNSILGPAVWTRTGNQANAWKQGTVQIPGGSASSQVTNVVFEGVRGSNILGDIAIDDIQLTAGQCAGSNTSSSTPADCTFETSNICGYIQDKTDVFDWSFQSGATATVNTGPTNDHTYGTASGHYVYIETSGARSQGDIARLWTPSLTPTNGRCLSFWYHMYGVTMGTLNVYAVQNSSNPSLGSPLWRRTGNAGNTWIQQFINLPALSNYNVSLFMFECILGHFSTKGVYR